MNTDKNCVSEVPIVITLDQAWEIVETYEKTGKWATMGLEGIGELALLNMIRKGSSVILFMPKQAIYTTSGWSNMIPNVNHGACSTQ